MKFMQFLILLFSISIDLAGQDSLWTKKHINEILTLDIPAEFNYSEYSNIREYIGFVKGNYFSFRFTDTTMKVKNAKEFRIRLTAWVDGMLAPPDYKAYNITIGDTSIGGSRGIFVKLNAKNTLMDFKQITVYVTLANDQVYVFQMASPSLLTTDQYFQSIVFDKEKVKENSYDIQSIYFRYPNKAPQ